MLYFSQMINLGKKKERLFDASFEAWDYGPVIADLYHKLKAFGVKTCFKYF